MSYGRKRLAVVAALVGVCAVVAGIAYAQIPSGGVITACYLKSGGTLRVIDATTGNCSTKETRLDWNQQGAVGPAGPAGPAGPTGATGADGVSGYEVVEASETYNAPFKSDPGALDARASCPQGKVLTGGGAHVQLFSATGFLRSGSVAALQPGGTQRPIGWTVYAEPPAADAAQMVVRAIAFCIAAT